MLYLNSISKGKKKKLWKVNSLNIKNRIFGKTISALFPHIKSKLCSFLLILPSIIRDQKCLFFKCKEQLNVGYEIVKMIHPFLSVLKMCFSKFHYHFKFLQFCLKLEIAFLFLKRKELC